MSGFVDECLINVRGGDGGAGCVSFRREAHVPKGGPDGGDGGNGGSVWLEADHNVASLLGFRDHPHRRAGNGKHGQGKNLHGPGGQDVVVKVPLHTMVSDRNGVLLADLANHGDRFLAARGGAGGRGNARFLSNRRRAPAFAEQGEYGEESWLRLDLKLMADVALVGYPNVGKSTFISRISAAKPKIADYPFTTLEPNLGVVRLDDGFEMIVADLPGLIEGAAEGKGLGHRFLRHIERARVLLLLIDLATPDERSVDEQERVLLHEIESYRPDLLRRPRVVIGSRADIAADDSGLLPVSAVTGEGVAATLGLLRKAVEQARREDVLDEGTVIHRPAGNDIVVHRLDDRSFAVEGRAAVRAVRLSDITNHDALEYARGRLKSLGVNRALARAGARPGDTIHIGDFAFDYEEDL